LQSKKEEFERLKTINFGTELAFRALYGKCFTLSTNEYTYEICPFNKVEQRAHSASSGTSLGNWKEWEMDGKVWSFREGMACWNGPQRSMTVCT
jgi:hypothetical protein